MPRPKKWRQVCCLPRKMAFVPVGMKFGSVDAVVMTVDEYETIRLIDCEGMTQEACGKNMQIARTTVQQIYNTARKKLGSALVEGKPLLIEGGEYRLSEECDPLCGCEGCCARRLPKRQSDMSGKEKREMKLAIPVNENRMETEVCVSFGRTPYFMIYDPATKTAEFLENPAAQVEGGAGLLAAQTVVDSGAAVLLTVRCGQNAAQVLKAAEMKIYKTEGAGVQENLDAFEKGTLKELTKFHAGYQGVS